MSTPPDPRRKSDDEAIEALCFHLDRLQLGEPSGLASRSGLTDTHGELWSTILRRRLANRYSKVRSDRVQWMYRHFHLLNLMDAGNGTKKTAAYVAEMWGAKEKTLLTHANRKVEKVAAMAWIESALADITRPFPGGGPSMRREDALQALHARLRDTAKSR